MQQLSRVTGATIDVLRALQDSQGRSWGLLVVKSSGRPAGSVYPILARLERSGWLTCTWEEDDERPGPRRRYYEFTEPGAAAAQEVFHKFATKD